MSEPYTPDTAEVEDAWTSRFDGEHTGASGAERRGYEAEFDRWLAKARADAWREGYRAGSQDMSDLRAGKLTFQTITSNPYRQEADR